MHLEGCHVCGSLFLMNKYSKLVVRRVNAEVVVYNAEADEAMHWSR